MASDDWQVGDLAVCVDAVAQAGDMAHLPLSEGRVYTVAGAFRLRPNQSLDRCLDGLTLVEVAPMAGRLGFSADRFRKIRPDEQESCAPEFVTLLKRSRNRVPA